MSAGAVLAWAGGCFAAALVLTRLLRDFARRRHLLDHPNERSAHAAPTPRLGGIGLMVPFLAAGFALAARAPVSGAELLLLAATLLISVVGLVDDLRPLPARVRLGAQALAAAAVVLWQGERIRPALWPFGDWLPYPLLAAAAVVWVVWATNLYNFMDGIDGLAGGQAVLASLGLAGAALAIDDGRLALLLVALAASAAGFLRYNLPKASIFMGDAGSTAIGFFLAAAPFLGRERPVPVLAVALALSLFLLDATTTLVRRVLRGERWYAAHRTHLYQQPLAWGTPHGRITYTAYAGMAVVAGLAAAFPGASPAARSASLLVAVVLFLLAWAAVHLAAGRAQRPDGRPR